jgi:2-oxoisovalerate dehydrogenase E1 component
VAAQPRDRDDRHPVDRHFLDTVPTLAGRERPDGVDADRLLEVFAAQAGSRHVDLTARRLGGEGVGFYSIGSAGHESNAWVAAALRPTDPALLHYRSGAFYVERARQVPGQHPLRDMLRGIVAAADEPIAGGRHKVFGNADLSVVPQTSTIASHLPRAVGLGFAIGRAARLRVQGAWPADAVVVCSLGDASVNHSTAAGAVNASLHTAYQGVPMPLLLVCEDNGIGISVPTPHDWVATTYGQRPGLRYFAADGTDPAGCRDAARAAVDWVREHRSPAFLHLRMVRLMGHAGSDVESGYRTRADILADLARDPLLATAQALLDTGKLTPAEVVERYEQVRAEVDDLAAEAQRSPRLRSRGDVVAPLLVNRPAQVARRLAEQPAEPSPDRLTLAQAVNRALAETLDHEDRALVFGEDVARKGGVYGVTRGLRKRFGAARVFDTLLDEQSILGTALGLGLDGLLPIPEIQYLAYLHNAADQLRGEASTLGFFSSGRYRNPMVVRVAAYAYQKGFGGHFHNDNSVAALLDIPGLVVASPSRPEDAAAMLRTCAASALVDGRVCVFLEPIALYHQRDLLEPGDDGWLATYPAADPDGHVPIGRAGEHGDGTDLTLVTFGNGLPMSLRVADRLRADGIGARVLDLRWLAPLPVDDLLEAARATGGVIVVDETRRSGGVSEAVFTALVDRGYRGRVARVTSADSFVPLGDAANHVLLGEPEIEQAARAMVTTRAD